jgi:hypothetical protein
MEAMNPKNLSQYANLDKLYAAIKAGDLDDMPEWQWTELPTFGGEEPADTWGVWSWDETRLMVGTHKGDFEIVPRWTEEQHEYALATARRAGQEVREQWGEGDVEEMFEADLVGGSWDDVLPYATRDEIFEAYRGGYESEAAPELVPRG